MDNIEKLYWYLSPATLMIIRADLLGAETAHLIESDRTKEEQFLADHIKSIRKVVNEKIGE